MNSQTLLLIGILLIISGIILITITSFQGSTSSTAIGGFIGPIPFGFANTPLGWAIGGVIALLMLGFWLFGHRLV